MAQTFTGRFVRSRGWGRYIRSSPWCEGEGELVAADDGLVIRGTRRGWRGTTYLLALVVLVLAAGLASRALPRSARDLVTGGLVVVPYLALVLAGARRRVADEQRLAWRSVRTPVVSGAGDVVVLVGWLWTYRLRFQPAGDPHALVAALRR